MLGISKWPVFEMGWTGGHRLKKDTHTQRIQKIIIFYAKDLRNNYHFTQKIDFKKRILSSLEKPFGPIFCLMYQTGNQRVTRWLAAAVAAQWHSLRGYNTTMSNLRLGALVTTSRQDLRKCSWLGLLLLLLWLARRAAWLKCAQMSAVVRSCAGCLNGFKFRSTNWRKELLYVRRR